MAGSRDGEEENSRISDTLCSIVICNDASIRSGPIVFNPDFFVEKLRYDKPEVFIELVVSNITRLIDLPGREFSQLIGEEDPKLPGSNGTAAGFFRSLNFLKRKDKGVIFGAPLTEEGIAQVYQLVEYLHKNLRTEGLFRVPGNSVRQQMLKDSLNSGNDVDLDSGEFHPNDVATLLKIFLGELPEPLLTHRHFHAHLKIADLMLFDDRGNKTGMPDKERRIEALQLLFLLLPAANRNLLKLLLDLLYQTAKKQDRNKMSAYNLALMFAPHILWPKNAPAYIREHSRLQYGSRLHASKDDLDLLPSHGCLDFQLLKSQKRTRIGSSSSATNTFQDETQQRTEEALKDLFNHVHNMPDSAKKKKLIRQFTKQPNVGTPVSDMHTPPSKKHARSRSFSGLIKRKILGNQIILEKKNRNLTSESLTTGETEGASKENLHLLQRFQENGHMLRARLKLLEDGLSRKEVSCKRIKALLPSSQETSI